VPMAQAAATRIHDRPSPSALRAGPAGRHLVDVTMLFSPTGGGIRRYLLAKHHWLRRHTRIKHTILVPGQKDAGLPYDIITLASPALPLHGRYRMPIRTRALRERLARLTPDLIEVGDPYHVAWQALAVARRRSVPTVAFCHSDLIALADAWLGNTGAQAASRYIARLYAGFDLVLAPSASVASRLDAAGVRSVAIQPLGVDADIATPQAKDPGLRASLGIEPDARLLVFAGRMSPEKRIRDLMAAAGLLGRPYHLLLVGGRQRRALAPNVTLLEYQQDTRELARILASCDAFVHAGDQETFGLVVLEAMACGLPVVAARAGALEELVDESVGETFRARDPFDLVRAVDRLFDRDRVALGRAARQRAESHAWDAAFTQLIGHYWRLMSSSGPDLREVRRAG
jgi:alpha-1,6-mannosyltransferase